MPEFDINASADQVAALFNQGRGNDAVARLNALRRDQPLVMQEALDRYVATRATATIAALYTANVGMDALPGHGPNTHAPQRDLGRLIAAHGAPRFPQESETADLSQAQKYDVYASVIGVRGNEAARNALVSRDRVILGMRNETRTTDNQGRGEYDDRIVVVWRDANGGRHAREFNQANTEPTAQYDHHAGSDGHRIIKETRRPAPALERWPGYENVRRRDIEGDDANNDRVRDLGRLAAGTVEMEEARHSSNRQTPSGVEFSLRPSEEAIRNGRNMVQRDTNADGLFDSRDVNGLQDLNRTFKIHRGSNNNTDSAGCQTIGGGEHTAFIDTVRGNTHQTRWQYVLTPVAPEQTQQRPRPEGDHGRPRADAALPEGVDPRHPVNPQHADHRLHGQIDGHLRALGGEYARNAEAIGLSVLAAAKAHQITQADSLVPNRASDGLRADETLFLVQGRPGDPAARRVALSVELAANTPVQASLARLDALNQAAPQAQASDPAQTQAPNPAPRRMG
ncbi:hypothetical protein LVB77_07995 [Lysobacter sp. 5GHs7-4]|uniref:XVIPCD domain-containing protein n=1 Tax=Lysobacter sp. 5GHs7-4 TaxID=2904253 RepID=UPI001E55B207|nr:XVIPCD domain-containing protein [Lysobacter sp. 5GHs7-4]UHQ24616.1 hypothetical protein LVB77_07995 [Lysobacter sp. 5GHs7-4]